MFTGTGCYNSTSLFGTSGVGTPRSFVHYRSILWNCVKAYHSLVRVCDVVIGVLMFYGLVECRNLLLVIACYLQRVICSLPDSN